MRITPTSNCTNYNAAIYFITVVIVKEYICLKTTLHTNTDTTKMANISGAEILIQRTVTTLAGIQMPKLIYGTAWKKEHTADFVLDALRAGFRGE